MDVSRIARAPYVLGLGALVLTLPLLLTGCALQEPSTDASGPGAGSDASADAGTTGSETESSGTGAADGTAIFRIGEELFAFSPTLCTVSEEDILVQGPGANAATGEIAFLDVDFTTFDGEVVGGADIKLGTDRPFTSPDDYYRLDPLFDGEGFTLTIDGRSFQADGAFHRHGAESSGGDSAGSGVLTVQCDGA